MDKADWAFAISMVSAIAAVASALFTWRQSALTKKGMKRKDVACEPRITKRRPDDGRRYISIDIRNLEPYAAIVTGVRVRSGRALIVRDPTAYESAAADTPSKRQPFRVRISGHNENPVRIKLIADTDLATRDLETEWEWLDGTKR